MHEDQTCDDIDDDIVSAVNDFNASIREAELVVYMPVKVAVEWPQASREG